MNILFSRPQVISFSEAKSDRRNLQAPFSYLVSTYCGESVFVLLGIAMSFFIIMLMIFAPKEKPNFSEKPKVMFHSNTCSSIKFAFD